MDQGTIKKMGKVVVTELDESMVRKDRERDRQNRRKMVYGTEAYREMEEELEIKQKEMEVGKVETVKSQYSETVSTSSSHTKSKERGKKGQGLCIGDFELGKKLG